MADLLFELNARLGAGLYRGAMQGGDSIRRRRLEARGWRVAGTGTGTYTDWLTSTSVLGLDALYEEKSNAKSTRGQQQVIRFCGGNRKSMQIQKPCCPVSCSGLT